MQSELLKLGLLLADSEGHVLNVSSFYMCIKLLGVIISFVIIMLLAAAADPK
jgi:hypothetical protein